MNLAEPAQPPTLPSRPALRDFGLVLAGKLLALGSLFVCGVLAARAVTPSEYGLYSAGLALVLLLDALIGAPFDIAAVRFGAEHGDDPDRVARLMGTTFRSKLVLGVLVLVLGMALARPLAALLFADASRRGMVALALLGTVALLALRGTAVSLQVQLRFRDYARLDAAQGSLRIAIVVALFVAGFRTADAYLATYVGAAAVVFGIGVVAIRQPYLRFGRPDSRDVRRLTSFAGITAGTIVLGTITGRADVIVLAMQGDALQVGYYGAAFQVAALLTLVAGYAGVVFQPRIVPAAREGTLARLLALGLAAGAGIGAACAAIGWWLASPAVSLVFGESYAPAAPVLRVLLLATGLDFLGVPILLHLVVQLFPRTLFRVELATTLLFLAVVPFAASQWGGWGVAWVQVGLRLLKLAVYLWIAIDGIARKRFDLGAAPVTPYRGAPPA
jgi:O-antigen/teichoic acid export membrane protein